MSHVGRIFRALPLRPRRLRVGLMAKILLATLLSAALPLILLSYSAEQASNDASTKATQVAANGLDAQAQNALEIQAEDVAGQVSQLLQGAVQNTLGAVALARTPQAFMAYYQAYSGQITYPGGTSQAPTKVTVSIPLYRELAFIDASGQERLVIREGKVVAPSQLRNVSAPQQTAYGDEAYFNATRALPAGQVYVSHLTAWYATDPRQPAGAVSSDAQAPAGA